MFSPPSLHGQQTLDGNNVVFGRVFFAPSVRKSKQRIQRERSESQPHGPATVNFRSREYALEKREQFLQLADKLVGEFLWHKHQFDLRVVHNDMELGPLEQWVSPFCLELKADVGDAIQDEWLMCLILFEITRRHAEVVVQVTDSDGEFLLIEAADYLPEWISPENSENRVFVRGGKLHIVADRVNPADSKTTATAAAAKEDEEEDEEDEDEEDEEEDASSRSGLSLTQGLQLLVTSKKSATLASETIQQAIDAHLQDMPEYIRNNKHHARCVLPVRAAQFLLKNPALVAPAVEAFYNREPSCAAKVCSQMRMFSPQQGVVELRVVFTRCMYAQLKQQDFHAPKPFLRATHAKYGVEASHVEFAAHHLGLKLTCGLELLYASDTKDQNGTKWSQVIDQLLQECCPIAEFVAPADHKLALDDDDSWMYLHPDTLEEKLHAWGLYEADSPAVHGQGPTKKDDMVGGAEELRTLATMFRDFMQENSDLSGVESKQGVDFDVDSFMRILKGEQRDSSRVEELDEEEEAYWNDLERHEDHVDGREQNEREEEEEEEALLQHQLDAMDRELTKSTLSKSFITRPATDPQPEIEQEEDDDDDEDEEEDDEDSDEKVQPLDLDFNLVSNLLESLAMQEGDPGPVTTMLSDMRL